MDVDYMSREGILKASLATIDLCTRYNYKELPLDDPIRKHIESLPTHYITLEEDNERKLKGLMITKKLIARGRIEGIYGRIKTI